eukprot:Gregarina_sp_Pseudo_9__2586@NODE_2850_length_851_cov_7_181034_g2608_i0_p4_GENE_NODE_2850_length_851_cov_7_181034_g2608_i0NODE_2850_length_851_cov_7_181034_g2608_i0_p4_ORF_typecomplete_len106_score6_83_NODE_2850_length_851_cov_7_181034_g2608_i0501818
MSFHIRSAVPPERLPYDLILFYQRGAYIREKAPRELPVNPIPWQTTDKPPGSKWTHGSIGRGQIFTYLMPWFPTTHPEFMESRIYAPAKMCHVARGAGSFCFRKN